MALNRLRKSPWQTIAIVGLSAMAASAYAIPPAICPLPPFEQAPQPKPAPATGTVTINADSVTALRQGVSLFKGDVDVFKDEKSLRADQATYDSAKRSITARGDVLFTTPTLEVKGDRGHYFLNSGLGTFFDAHFRLPKRHGRGTAGEVEVTGPGTSTLHDVTYTTCPLGHQDWALDTPHVDLNRNTDIGVAYNATIDFYGIPIFYTPYISFPLSDRRKSGFLAPTIGYSGQDGLDLTLPYYLNIAPNMDATIAPRYLGQRGVLINSQYRYLLPGTTGEFDYAVMPHDNLANARRSRFHFDDRTRISDMWGFSTNLNHVSDGDYFSDFGNSLSETSQVLQVSNVQLDYNNTNWSFLTRLRGYQALRGARPPYRELPQMVLDWQGPLQNYRLDYGVGSELVRFAYPGRVGAARLHVQPMIDYTFGSNAWYVRPTARYDLAAYQLYNVHDPLKPTQLSRAAPILSLNSGVTFERDAFGGLIETLEPRLFYLYVPYRDQSDIPLFDTSQATFNFLQLFSDNRFNGTDRLGDANQISYALTTRFIHPDTGKELLAASIGQIHYFSDRRVTLPGQPPQTNQVSDLIGELRLDVNDDWTTAAGLQWNPNTRHNDVGRFQVRYQPGPRQVVNLGYRYRRDRLEETDLSLAWPLTQHWQVVGRWNYSLRDQATRETFAGFEYQNCCWAFLFLDRHYLRPNGKVTQALYFEIQFKGLGRLGRQIEDFLERGILGYGD
ncbi:MAG TPA: LPS assembly protein LptD [Gammaproteobacteria bacterium]|nr:LPS assembly protein LptD [Gammaproteobacteria bacterium]